MIIVIQENRGPENLFNQDSVLVQNHAHVQPSSNAGLCNVPGHRTISLTPTPLFTCWDPTHNHAGTHPSWVTTWDNGAMDGACGNYIAGITSQCPPTYCTVSTNPYFSTCGYSYVDNSTGILAPRFHHIPRVSDHQRVEVLTGLLSPPQGSKLLPDLSHGPRQ